MERPLAIVQYPEPYVQPLIVKALQNLPGLEFEVEEHQGARSRSGRRCVQFADYEALDFEYAAAHPELVLTCAYVIRKALIRKHYLSNTIASWLVKHPDSLLRDHFKRSVHFELDYAEFLDDALVDAWDLHESMARNNTNSAGKEWWILKPGMSDGAHGIRLFSSIDQLQEIFEAWDPDSEDEEQDDDRGQEGTREDSNDRTEMTSQLRHFIAQPYVDPPLLLASQNHRKFHIRTYIVALGALKVFVYREMLALFSAKPYISPSESSSDELDLAQHLTNTCLQEESTKNTSVCRYWSLEDTGAPSNWKHSVFTQICNITGELFEAAAREQMIHFQTIPNAFEVFGLDFLVDQNHRVWLLEVNAYPDFKQTGPELQEIVVGGLFDGVARVAVAPFFGQDACAQGDESMVLVRELDLGRR